MKTLVFWEQGSLARAHRLRGTGAVLVAWSARASRSLQRAGVDYANLGSILDHEAIVALDEVAIAWTKNWGRRPLLDGRSFRDLLDWRGISLWWFAELYLYHCTRAPKFVRWIEMIGRWIKRENPDEIDGVGLGAPESALLARTCTEHGVLFVGRVSRLQGGRRARRVSLQSRWNTWKMIGSAVKAAFRGGTPRRERADVLFLSHAAFWRLRQEKGPLDEYEHYFDRVIPEVERLEKLRASVVSIGPNVAHRRRRAWRRWLDWIRLDRGRRSRLPMSRFTSFRVAAQVVRATGGIREAWRGLRDAPGTHEAFSHAGIRFFDLVAADLAETMLLQLPWAVRCCEEATSALESLRPSVICLYAESSGWGRAALAAGQAAGIPTVALQHGILYPRYYSYRHDADEGACPRPDRTAVFGEDARRLLVERGGYDPETVVVTGSPKFDALLDAARVWNRDETRAQFGVGLKERLILVASRFREIRDTHRAIGSEFSALARAVESMRGVKCVVKPHPAESAAPYEGCLRAINARKTRMAAPSADLVRLIHAADALVTVESLTAMEALVLQRPILILNMPSHLKDLIDRGVAMGVSAGADPATALRNLLFDDDARERLAAARRLYLDDFARGIDGGATRRIVELIAATARRSSRDSLREP
ncbi:MAG: CDP-glycerol glycerophosphotransferase family protein [Vicinamibacteria bacterium]|nr:CDP-glycerol glycerophosphotransferase family protein [Vicinamibacteria bacterium]